MSAPEQNHKHAEREAELRDAISFTQSIVDAVREPLLVLDANLCVTTASHAFYQAFRVSPDQTIGRFIMTSETVSGTSLHSGLFSKKCCRSTRPLMTSKWSMTFRNRKEGHAPKR